MAITYDYNYNIVGDALGPVINTSQTSVSLTELTNGEDYEVRVFQRQDESGVLYFSSVGVATFTAISSAVSVDLPLIAHNVTMNSVTVATPITVELGTVIPAPTVNAIAPVIVITGTSYNLKVEHIEGATTDYIESLVNSSYGLTGLVENDTYEVSVQTIERVSGAEYPHPYTPVVAFSPADIDPTIRISLDLLNPALTANALTIHNPQPPVITDLGLVSDSPTLNPVSVFIDSTVRVNLSLASPITTIGQLTVLNPKSPVIVGLSLVNLTPTLNILETYQEGLEAYKLKVTQDGGATIVIEDITGNSYNLTGLTEGETYTVAVAPSNNSVDHEGVTYYKSYSEGLSFLSEFRPVVSVDLLPITPVALLEPLTVFDEILKVLNFAYDNQGDDFTVTGEALPSIQNITITVNGNLMDTTFDGTLFEGVLTREALLIPHTDEIDGYQGLSIDSQILEVQ